MKLNHRLNTIQKRSLSIKKTVILLTCVAGIMLLSFSLAPSGKAVAGSSQSISLGTSGSYSVLAATAVTNTGNSVLSQDLGLTNSAASALTGFLPGLVNGTIEQGNAAATQAENDTITAYNNAAGQTPVTQVPANLGGTTLDAGVYATASGAFSLTGTLTLDGQGNPNGVFIFQTSSTLVTASASTIVLINSANPCNIYWQVGSSTTLGTGSSFQGTILALTSITANTSATIAGRLLAMNGAVTLDSNQITQPGCLISSSTSSVTTTSSTTSTASANTTTSLLTVVPNAVTAVTGKAFLGQGIQSAFLMVLALGTTLVLIRSRNRKN